ncbi:hypothetical protein BGZ73_007481 [Actinomortierella ambigua]|nr:hypothetical protein BGZ73_007481 [Actinomortierella ambigua]
MDADQDNSAMVLHHVMNNESGNRNISAVLEVEEGARLPPQEEKAEKLRKAKSRTWLFMAMIIPNAILGVLIRLGIVYIQTFPGQPVFPLVWAQFIGCLIMGLLVSTRRRIDRCHWTGPFTYAGLGSGLCGSITTFSSWSLGIFTELANVNRSPHHPLQNILAGIAEMTVTISMSLVGFTLGKHLGSALKHYLNDSKEFNVGNKVRIDDVPVQEERPPLPPATYWTLLEMAIGCSSLILWIGVILAAIWMEPSSSWRHVVMATVFAPAGALIRWYLSRFNGRYPTFPIGTFAVNVVGSWILAAIVTLQFTSLLSSSSNRLGCQILVGLQDGLCGCLTTISTFTVELVTLDRKSAYRYAIVSIILAQVGMITIFGSFMWTRPGHYVGSKCSP